ncbi:MAG: Bug family tripartite tricarboxylate transporter substrate binding protein [Alphaproteobacteria bacterium]
MKVKLRNIIIAGMALFTVSAMAFEPKKPECIAPAKPGGGFDLTCRIATTALDEAKILNKPMAVTFMPGGIGAVAINQMIGPKKKNGDSIVAFSSGSLLNIAAGKYGPHIKGDSVRWLASAGADYGAIVVYKDSPLNSLDDIINKIKEDPAAISFGAGGSVGSQDWTKAALLFKAAGIDPKKMRYLAFDGGGEAIASLMGGHIDVYPGDAAELVGHIDSGDFKVLAIYSNERLPGKLADIPTAKEQGYDLEWTILRGYYMAPEAPDEAYNYYVDAFNKLYQSEEFTKIQAEKGLFPFNQAGPEFDTYIKERINYFSELVEEFGLGAKK